MIEKDLDKYYTKQLVAQQCINILIKELSKFNIDTNQLFFIEPSAGNGSFVKCLPQNQFFACDIYPEDKNIFKKDFINENIGIEKSSYNVIIGNPPFGKRGKVALNFINKGFDYANIVAFILPVQFRKWNIQKNIKNNVKLFYDVDIHNNSFIFKGKDYNLRCCFQIWIDQDFQNFETIKNKRILKPPKIEHEDFKMYQYNCTQQALKYFDYDWDFAVLRQGWGDFNEIFYYSDKNKMSKKKQWIFFKAKNKKILNRLKKIDFNEISNLNTSTKGFGKADIIQFYEKRWKNE